jgi:hypothetical protein
MEPGFDAAIAASNPALMWFGQRAIIKLTSKLLSGRLAAAQKSFIPRQAGNAGAHVGERIRERRISTQADRHSEYQPGQDIVP